MVTFRENWRSSYVGWDFQGKRDCVYGSKFYHEEPDVSLGYQRLHGHKHSRLAPYLRTHIKGKLISRDAMQCSEQTVESRGYDVDQTNIRWALAPDLEVTLSPSFALSSPPSSVE